MGEVFSAVHQRSSDMRRPLQAVEACLVLEPRSQPQAAQAMRPRLQAVEACLAAQALEVYLGDVLRPQTVAAAEASSELARGHLPRAEGFSEAPFPLQAVKAYLEVTVHL